MIVVFKSKDGVKAGQKHFSSYEKAKEWASKEILTSAYDLEIFDLNNKKWLGSWLAPVKA